MFLLSHSRHPTPGRWPPRRKTYNNVVCRSNTLLTSQEKHFHCSTSMQGCHQEFFQGGGRNIRLKKFQIQMQGASALLCPHPRGRPCVQGFISIRRTPSCDITPTTVTCGITPINVTCGITPINVTAAICCVRALTRTEEVTYTNVVFRL